MIRILDKQIADKIAAGEVIERPVSIIKELVENSIDAGADSIVVEIKKGGKSYIRVTDNGCGIAREEVETAFLRHATSKIETVRDLESIETLGFRGEALASVCAVTRTELLTKRKEDKTGTRLVIHGGEIISNMATGCPDGTTIIITDLFYNTPARLKFMKSDSAESSMIIDLMSQLALAYKDISFRLVNNGNILFTTTGDGNRLNIISRVFPGVDTKNLVPVDLEEGPIELTGYISTPSMSRPSRNGQIFFVNGRVVNSKVIERGINEGYRERLFDGRHPLAYLFLNVNASDLDVNIHPNKKEVRFNNEGEISEFISQAIKKALGTKEAVVRVANIFKEEPVKYQAKPSVEEQVSLKSITSTKPTTEPVVETPVVREIEVPKVEKPEVKASKPVSVPVVEMPKSVEIQTIETIEVPPVTPTIEIKKPILTPFDFDDLTIKGALFNTYIMAVDGDNFFLIDQHAAHERIFYEKLVGEYEKEEKTRQPILFPLIIDVDLKTKEEDAKWLQILNNMGFTIEAFGQNSYRISEIPTFMELSEAEDFINDFVDSITTTTNFRNSIVINKLIMKSCKSAIKANDHLEKEEIDALIKDLKNCINPFSCPHGRPTFIKLSRYEIERLFKRV